MSATVMQPQASRQGSSEWKEALPYVAPFAIFILFLAASDTLSFLGRAEYPIRTAAMIASIFFFSRKVLDWRLAAPLSSIGIGVLVFALWIFPDVAFPGYREHWLFQNSITGRVQSGLQPGFRDDFMVLALRFFRAAVLVAIIEELFWRGWLMRWLISNRFLTIPLGAYTASSFWITAALFASEHGPYWEVGLLAGIVYNWWMIRTKSLADCILAHGVTNAILSAYVIATGNWQYWM